MLIIDENLFRLTKMYESLLKVDRINRVENLNKYKENAIKIDSALFDAFLEKISHINEHNHTLEKELSFLESIRDEYKELNDLQVRFKNVCELYGDSLKLSDLSRVKIDYINERISTINGYLINNKNIEKNKIKIQELNEQLINEEKKKKFLEDKIVELEKILKDSFANTEGRLLVDGKLQYTSVLTEYENLGFDVLELLNNQTLLDENLSKYGKKRNEVSESVRAAELCYNSLLNSESKQVLIDTKKELLMVKYKLTMLKIVKKISLICDDYDQFINKREQLLDLIKYRLDCLKELGIKLSIDPFSRIKINEQLELVSSFSNNSKNISRLMKLISELNTRIEDMVSANQKYSVALTASDDLLENKVAFADIGIEISDEFNFEDMLTKKEVTDNQVINVRDFTSRFNIYVVNQKTTSVIRRVSNMLSKNKLHSKTKSSDSYSPDLVIVPKKPEKMEFIDNSINFEESIFPVYDSDIILEVPSVFVSEPVVETSNIVDVSSINDTMFETIVPFEAPSFFENKVDEDIFNNSDSPFVDTKVEEDVLDNQNISDNVQENIANVDYFQEQEQMPDVFWKVQDEIGKQENVIQFVPSFDDQINKLLVNEEEEAKTKRKVV